MDLDSQKKLGLSVNELRVLTEELELLEKMLLREMDSKERFLLFRKLKNIFKQISIAGSD